MRQAFKNPTKTYASYKNAKKVIDGLEDGDYSWSIMATEEGRFFPHVSYPAATTNLSHFYFIEKGCCVSVT